MKRIVFFVIACTFVTVPAMADFYGGQVYWDRLSGYYSGNGGEFTFRSDGGPGLLLSNNAYDATTSGLGTWGESFQTFCLEGGEHVYTGQSLDIMVSTYFIDESTGDITGAGSHAILGGLTYGDNLDPRTAYLYTQFAEGTLSNYDYVAGAGRVASAGALQNAIWWIEGEGGSDADQAGLWITEAQDAIDSEAWSGIGNVRVLNTWVPDHIGNLSYARQDMLFLVPTPAAVILGILGLSAVGVKLRKYT